jgi:hypothetical protein
MLHNPGFPRYSSLKILYTSSTIVPRFHVNFTHLSTGSAFDISSSISRPPGRASNRRYVHPLTSKSWHVLIALYEAWGRPEKAQEWRSKLPEAENIRK